MHFLCAPQSARATSAEESARQAGLVAGIHEAATGLAQASVPARATGRSSPASWCCNARCFWRGRPVTPFRYLAAVAWIAVRIAAVLGACGGALELVFRRWTRALGLVLAAALVLGDGPALQAWTAPAVREGRSLLKSRVCSMFPTSRQQRRCRAQI